MASTEIPVARPLGLPRPRDKQDLFSSTFTPPPFDGSLIFSEMQDWHYKHSPDHPLFVYATEDGQTSTITWSRAIMAIHRAARTVSDLVTKQSSRLPLARPVIAILMAGNDTVPYFTLMSGIIRSGYAAFPISTKASPDIIAHLLPQVGATHIIVGRERSLEDLASASLTLLAEHGNDSPPARSVAPSFIDLYRSASSAPFVPFPSIQYEWDDPILILHSSGSTGTPKPIVCTQRRVILGITSPTHGERNLTGRKISCHALYMFHGTGLIQMGWTAVSGLVLTVCNPLSPPIPPNPLLIMKDAIATRSDYIFTPPILIQIWAKIPEYVRYMASIDGIIFCGGLVPGPIGDSLTSAGVTLLNAYGTSECAIVSTVFPKSVGRDWEYFTFSAHVKPHLIPEDDGSVELIMLSHQTHEPCIINTFVNGEGGYATSDLLLPHPSKPGYWKVLGRKDDRIIHSSGKTHPAPFENILVQDPLVQAVVMFGNGRANAGILVEPKVEHRFDPTNQEKLAAFRDKLWPAVDKMNETAFEQSRVYKEMIIVASPLKPFSYTAKATPRRNVILEDYKGEIDAIYAEFQERTQCGLLPPKWDLLSTTNYIRAIVCRILGRPVDDAANLVRVDRESSFAPLIRYTLLHALSTAGTNVQVLPYDLVPQYPSISSLGVYISELVGGHDPRP